MKQPGFIVVIGASAGGLSALVEVIGQLKPEMNAAYFIVMHLSSNAIGNFLVQKLQPFTSIPCSIAHHEEAIEKNRIYIAPPNRHLVQNILLPGQISFGVTSAFHKFITTWETFFPGMRDAKERLSIFSYPRWSFPERPLHRSASSWNSYVPALHLPSQGEFRWIVSGSLQSVHRRIEG